MIIKIKTHTSNPIPQVYKLGDWIDLRAARDYTFKAPRINKKQIEFDIQKISLGISMELPKGYEAWIAARSSTFKEFGLIQVNTPGIIDNSYNGSEDIWKFQAFSLRDTFIEKGDIICQFRIKLSQKASIWQKIKWLFSSKNIKFKIVDNLNNINRGGFGTTSKK